MLTTLSSTKWGNFKSWSETTNLEEGDIKFTDDHVGLQVAELKHVWRRYGYQPIIEHCAEQALQEQLVIGRKEYAMKMPWVNQRLAQWVLADPDCDRVGLRSLSRQDFSHLLQKTHDFVQSTAPTSRIKGQGLSAVRAIAFQQFEFQHHSQFAIDRQYYIFSRLPANHRLRRHCDIALTVDSDDLFVGSLLIGGHVLSNPGKAISTQELLKQAPWFPKDKLTVILNCLSNDVEKMRMRFRVQSYRQISISSALHSSAFADTPFLEMAGRRHIPWSPRLVIRALGDIAYTSLKQSGNLDLLSDYGQVFENKYVAPALKLMCDTIYFEDDLRKKLAKSEMTVDFV